jgi:hypothetical protein
MKTEDSHNVQKFTDRNSKNGLIQMLGRKYEPTTNDEFSIVQVIRNVEVRKWWPVLQIN